MARNVRRHEDSVHGSTKLTTNGSEDASKPFTLSFVEGLL